MNPNPNPSPELREAAEALLLAMTTRALRGRDHVPSMRDEQTAASALRAALSPQTLPAPGEVELREAYIAGFAQALYNLELTPNAFFDAWLDFGQYYGLEKEQFDPDVIHTPALATVAAANDEGVARIRSAIWSYVNAQPEDAATLPVVQFLANRDVFLAEAIALATSRSQHEGASS